jgi:beta-glucuronidase
MASEQELLAIVVSRHGSRQPQIQAMRVGNLPTRASIGQPRVRSGLGYEHAHAFATMGAMTQNLKALLAGAFLSAVMATTAHAQAGLPALPVLPGLPLATATTSPQLVSADMRAGLDLSGAWHWSIDPYRSGLAGFHGEAPDAGQQRWRDVDVRQAMADDNRVLYEFDLAHSPVATLPSSWLTQAPELRHYQGLVWYQRTFQATAPKGPGAGRQFLRFGAANYSAVVYVNGRPVGRHEGGFTPFAVEVTTLLRDGDNQVTVGVDSQATPATVPPPVTDWENYGGLTRPVRLVATPATFVDDAWVRLTRDG